MSEIFFRPQLFELLDNWKGKFLLHHPQFEDQCIDITRMEAYEFLYKHYPTISIAVDEEHDNMILHPTPNYTSVMIIKDL